MTTQGRGAGIGRGERGLATGSRRVGRGAVAGRRNQLSGKCRRSLGCRALGSLELGFIRAEFAQNLGRGALDPVERLEE